jgi:uracil-DNA glycosylase family 4
MADKLEREQPSMNPWMATLQWYADLGVDEAISESPWDRFKTGVAKPEPTLKPTASTTNAPAPAKALPPQPPPRVPAPSPVATDLDNVGDLETLRTRLEQFEGCALKATATHTVFGAGPADARLMIIGEAPGEEEDRRGEPFVGVSGKLLERMLGSIGLNRADVYITNTIYWRPPGNRTPTPAEVQTCLPFLRRQIALIRPDVLLLVGGAAAKTMLERPEGIMRLRGRWFDYNFSPDHPAIPALATFHPAFLLRSPAQKREAWLDLLALKHRMA